MNNEKRQLVAEVIERNPVTNSIYYELLEKQIALFLYEKKVAMSMSEIFSKLKDNKIYISKKDLRTILHNMVNKYISHTYAENVVTLLPSAKKTILEKHERYNHGISSVIAKFFTSGISLSSNTIRQWLDEMLMAIFEKYFATMLTRIRFKEKTDLDLLEINTIHHSILSKFNAGKEDEEILSVQFRKMMVSDDLDVLFLLNYYIRLSYSSLVLTTKTYASESVAEYFRDKIVILDTNVLIALQLEKANNYKVNLEAINDLCRKENITLCYLPATEAEYKRVVEAKKQEYSELYSGFSLKVMDERMRSNNIVHALRKSACISSKDVETFFDEHLMTIPNRVDDDNSVEITLLEDDIWMDVFRLESKIEDAKDAFRSIYAGNRNDNCEDEVDADWSVRYTSENDVHIKKSDKVVEHDLGLIGYVRAKRGVSEYGIRSGIEQNDNVLLLTMDSSLIKYTITMYPDADFAYGVRDIITLLSLNRGGVLGNKSSYFQMLRGFVLNNFIIWEDSYDVKDLSLILNVENQVGSLDDTKVRQIACEVRKMRLSGNTPHIHRYLMKELNFEYSELTREKESLASKYLDKSNKLEEVESKFSKVQQENMQLREGEFNRLYKDEYNKRKRNYRWMTILKIVFIILVIASLIAAVLIMLVSYEVLKMNCSWLSKSRNLTIPGVLAITSILADFFGLKNFRNRKDSGYYNDVKIKEAVLQSMKLDTSIAEYIHKGFLEKE